MLSLSALQMQAQMDSVSNPKKPKLNCKNSDSIYKQQDFTDILFKVIHIKAKADTAKLKPGKLYLAVFPAVGYTTANSGTATVAANASFYTASLDSTNLSSVLTYPLYSLYKQIIVPVISSVWTKKMILTY